MGLLDRLVNGASADGATGMGRTPSGPDGARIVRALLPAVVAMLSSRRGVPARDAGAVPGWQRTGPNGLGGLGMSGGLGALGALGGLLGLLSQRGYGTQAESWIGIGPNEPLPESAIGEVFDPGELSRLASETGLGEDEARWGLSRLLPDVVDDLTPDGALPSEDELQLRLEGYDRDLSA